MKQHLVIQRDFPRDTPSLSVTAILTVSSFQADVNYMLNELIAYVILPDLLRFLILEKKHH